MSASTPTQPRLAPIPRAAASRVGEDDDPLARVEQLGRRSSRMGMALGVIFALSTHGAGSARAMSALLEMHEMVEVMRKELHEFFWANYDIDVVKDKKKEEEPPQPEPEPEPEQPEPTPVAEEEPPEDEDPYAEDEPPPPPGEASKILTAPEDPNDPVDLTGEGFVTGDGTGPGYGYVSAMGTAKQPTYNRNARVGGVEGGRGTAPTQTRPKKKKPPNRSRPAGLVGGRSWNCPFPPEADIEQIDRATAVIVVTVSESGRPTSVRVLSDPGYGFGRAAKQCAMGRRYEPALNRVGKPIRSTTPPINVRFRR